MSDKCHTKILIFLDEKCRKFCFFKIVLWLICDVIWYFGDVWSNIRASKQYKQAYKSSLGCPHKFMFIQISLKSESIMTKNTVKCQNIRKIQILGRKTRKTRKLIFVEFVPGSSCVFSLCVWRWECLATDEWNYSGVRRGRQVELNACRDGTHSLTIFIWSL